MQAALFLGHAHPTPRKGTARVKATPPFSLPSLFSMLRPLRQLLLLPCPGSGALCNQGTPGESREEKDAVGVSQQPLNVVSGFTTQSRSVLLLCTHKTVQRTSCFHATPAGGIRSRINAASSSQPGEPTCPTCLVKVVFK